MNILKSIPVCCVFLAQSKRPSIWPCLTRTHPSRDPLIAAAKETNESRLNPFEFYKILAASRFIFSPVGDRPDCYRHWEAIGLGTIPICNCPAIFNTLFHDSMLYVADGDYKLMLGMSSKWATSVYHNPDRRLILTQHWRKHFEHLKIQITTFHDKLRS